MQELHRRGVGGLTIERRSASGQPGHSRGSGRSPDVYGTGKSITGSLIAGSVFRPWLLPPLDAAKEHVYYLYHSPDDSVCPFRMAEAAQKALEENGAKVKLATYEGGHGWKGRVYVDIREGIQWLKEQTRE